MPAVFYDDGPLFNGLALTTFLSNQNSRAVSSVDSYGWESFLSVDGQPDLEKHEGLVASIAAQFGVQRLEIDYAAVSRTELSEVDGVLATTISLPFTGHPELFRFTINHSAPFSEPVHGNVVTGASDIEPARLVFWLRDRDLGAAYEALLAQRQQWLRSKVEFVNRQVDDFNSALAEQIRRLVVKRGEVMSRMRAAEAAMTIPLSKRPDPPIALPVDRRTLDEPRRATRARSSTPTAGAASGPEWVLEDSAFDEVVRTLVLFAAAAGRLPASVGKLGENDFRNFALLVLNANFYFTSARGEVFNGKGKSDLLVPWGGGNALVGEFKKFDGAQSVSNALSQLLKYVTWTDTNAEGGRESENSRPPLVAPLLRDGPPLERVWISPGTYPRAATAATTSTRPWPLSYDVVPTAPGS